MTDLLVFIFTPDQTVLKMAQVAVTEEGHHLQTSQTSAELLDALGSHNNHIWFLEPEKNGEELYHKLLRYVLESSLFHGEAG